jgi:hypothetical protein
MRKATPSPAETSLPVTTFMSMYRPGAKIQGDRLSIAIKMWDRFCNELPDDELPKLDSDADVAAFISDAVAASASLAGIRHNISEPKLDKTAAKIGRMMGSAIPHRELPHATEIAKKTSDEISKILKQYDKDIPFGAIPVRPNVTRAAEKTAASLPGIPVAQRVRARMSEVDYKKVTAASAAAATLAIGVVNSTATAAAETTSGGAATNAAGTSQVVSRENLTSAAANQALQNFPSMQPTQPEQTANTDQPATASPNAATASEQAATQKPEPGSQITVIAPPTTPTPETTPSPSTAPTPENSATPSPEATTPVPPSTDNPSTPPASTPDTTSTPAPSATESSTPQQNTTPTPQPEQTPDQQSMIEKVSSEIDQNLTVGLAGQIISGLAPGSNPYGGIEGSVPLQSGVSLADTKTKPTIWGSEPAPAAVQELISPAVQEGQAVAEKNVELLFASIAMPGMSVDNGDRSTEPGGSNSGNENVNLTKVRNSAFMDRVKDLRQQSNTPLSSDTLYKLFTDADNKYNHPVINRELIMSMAYRESLLGKLTNPSSKGARGIVQFMPGTWEEWGKGKDIMDNAANIDASFRYMIYLYKWTGNAFPHANEGMRVKLALAAYNWGMGNVRNLGRLPTLKESSSRGYADAIYASAQKTIKHIQDAVRQAKESTANNDNDNLPNAFTSALKKEIADLNRTNAEKADITALVSEAITLARHYEVPRNNPVKPTAAMIRALEKYGYDAKDTGNLAPIYDCLKDVTVLNRESGVDPSFNSMGLNTEGLFAYVQKHTVNGVTDLGGDVKYQVIKNPAKADLQPGDTVLGRGHVLMWTGPIEGANGKIYHMVEAALGSKRVFSFRDGSDEWTWIKNYMKFRGGTVALRVIHADNNTDMN